VLLSDGHYFNQHRPSIIEFNCLSKLEPRVTAQKIQVVCPPDLTTGGPEALHQLVHAARQQGIDARVVYLPKAAGAIATTAVPYKIYDVVIDQDIIDEPETLVVVSEVDTGILKDLKHAKKAIWWLSIDNYLLTRGGRVKRLLGLQKVFDIDRPDAGVYHLAQSEYARQFLSNKGLKSVQMLTDHLRDDFVAAVEAETNHGTRIRRVAYNPKKGLEFTQMIIDLAGTDIEFVRLENMRPDQVRDTLMTSMIYMDFGHHPGRDRIPREAAMCGCSVITGRRGSAANNIDVPIEDRYKIDETASDFAQRAVAVIKDIFDREENHRAAFDAYREIIRHQKIVFFAEVASVVASVFQPKFLDS
jgi:hypothetical protein